MFEAAPTSVHYFEYKGETVWVRPHAKITYWLWINNLLLIQKPYAYIRLFLAVSDDMCSESNELVKAADSGD